MTTLTHLRTAIANLRQAERNRLWQDAEPLARAEAEVNAALDALEGAQGVEVKPRAWCECYRRNAVSDECENCDGQFAGALSPAHVPEGFVLVPREPTEAMERAGGRANDKAQACSGDFDNCGHCAVKKHPVGDSCTDGAVAAYRAMIDAAPQPKETDK